MASKYLGGQRSRAMIGVVSDKAKIAAANMGSEYKDLDIAIVKATNHDEVPPKEKHVRTIFAALGAHRPRADVSYTITTLQKRLRSSPDWIVVLKCLMVFHRALREVDPSFREMLLHQSQNAHFLNLANFKDESHPDAWDHSAWVRTYSLYLEERIETERALNFDVESEGTTEHSRTRTLDTAGLLVWLPRLQAQMSRLINCRPEGASSRNGVVAIAMGMVLKESFKLYRAINDGIINLVDKFFEMQRSDALKALDIYRLAGKQAERLQTFYDHAKHIDITGRIQFPELEQPPASFLATMEEYVREVPGTEIVPAKPSRATGASRPQYQNLTKGVGAVPSSGRLSLPPPGGASAAAPAVAAAPAPAAFDLLADLSIEAAPAQTQGGFGDSTVPSDPFASSSSSVDPFAAVPSTFPANGTDSFGQLALPSTAPAQQPPQQQPSQPSGLNKNMLDSLYSSPQPQPAAGLFGSQQMPTGGRYGPQGGYGAPPQGFGGPQQGFGGPQQGYGGPQQGFGSPQQGYGVPQQGFGGPPPQGFGGPPAGGANPFGGPSPPRPQMQSVAGNPFGAASAAPGSNPFAAAGFNPPPQLNQNSNPFGSNPFADAPPSNNQNFL
eukprot:jgi/Chlat1/1928/Chrsp153S02239